jgi:Protein of unknown function (DUF4238)
MNQHYVPEFYLKYFSQNGKQIFVYDKVVQKSFSSSISSIASQQEFYVNTDKKSIEDEIGIVESETGIILKELIELLVSNQFKTITGNQRDTLIRFIWLQMNRTLESRIDIGSILPRLFSKLADEPFELEVKEILSQREVADNHIDFIQSHKTNEFALEMLADRNFIIVKNETSTDFLTSDEPVVTHLHWEIGPKVYEIFLPITPRFGIWIVPKNMYKELDAADNILYSLTEVQNILFYNYHQIYHSTRQIFSKTGDFEYVRQIFINEPTFGNLNKKRID